MKAAHDSSDRGLDSATRARIRDLFRGHVCCQCPAAASQLSADRFYCDAHIPGGRRQMPAAGRVYGVGTLQADGSEKAATKRQPTGDDDDKRAR